MTTVTVRNPAGQETGSVELDPEVFAVEPNVAVMHQVVTAQLAARRRGTQSTRTKAEVKGGGGKPWRQKGTGRARHGSTRNPQWRGGGVALGPKPRSYRQRTPKKMIRLALRSALSDRVRDGRVVVVDNWTFEIPSTKAANAALDALGVEGRALMVAERDQPAVWKSFRNLPRVHLVSPGELNAYDVLVSDTVVFTLDTLLATTPTATPAGTDEAASADSTPDGTDEAPDDSTPAETDEAPDDSTPAETDEAPDDSTPAETDEAPDDSTPAETDEAPDDSTPAETDEAPDDSTPAETDEAASAEGDEAEEDKAEGDEA